MGDWQHIVEQVKEKVEKLTEKESLIFPIFTDLHTESAECEYTDRLVSALSKITENIQADAVINLGDNLSMLGRRDKVENNTLKKIFTDLFDIIYKKINCPMITVNGNHDAIGTDFFKPDFWNDIVKGKYGNTEAKYSESGSYYYVDYDKADTRLVVLSMPCDSDLEAEHPTPLWKFGEKQLEWLENEALNTEKYVIILSHAPFYYEYKGGETMLLEVYTGERVAYSHYANLCGWLEDRDEAVRIIENSSAKIVCCLSGHTHADSMWMPKEERGEFKNPLPCPQLVTGMACIPEWETSEYGVQIDIAVLTPSKNEFNFIRFGDGENRKLMM